METQRKTLVRLLALALGAAGAGEVLAATRYFDCANGNMQTASCWSSNIKPVAGDNAFLGYASFASSVTATLNSGSFAATNEYIGFSGGYTGTVNHSAGSHTVSNRLYVGYQNVGDLSRYNLSGTATLTANAETLGYNGAGIINQSGGTHTVSTNLTMGANSGSGGNYILTGGTLTVNGSILGGAGYGNIYINSGMMSVGDSINGPSSIYLSIQGGSLQVANSINVRAFSLSASESSVTFTQSSALAMASNYLTVGYPSSYGSSHYVQTGGTHMVGEQVTIGYGTGSYTLSGGSFSVGNSVYVGWEGNGSFIQSGGTSTVGTLSLGNDYNGGQGTYNLQGGQLNAGQINVINTNTGINPSVSVFNFTGGTLAVGTFIGNLTNDGGTLAPGASPGTTLVQGDYTQGATGILSIELGGTGAGLFDVLQVTGTATLAGELDVAFWNGFSAAAGDSFDIMSATNLTGSFETFNLAALGAGLVWDVDYLYDQDVAGTDYLRLSVQAVPEAETYAMMLAGLGLVGWAARRRKASHKV